MKYLIQTKRSAISAFFVLALLLMPAFVQAQTIRFRSGQDRVTVPLNFTGSLLLTNSVNVANLSNNVVFFDVSGLPTGATYNLTDTNGNALLSTTITTNLWLTLNLANVAEGVYTFSLNGGNLVNQLGGVTNNLLFTLQVGYIWNGTTNVTTTWVNPASWVGGVVPGAGDDVIFSQIGAQTNVPGQTFFTNSIVDQNATIGSLRFSQTNNNARLHTILINPGVTLAITGTNGLSVLRDYVGFLALPAQTLASVGFVGGSGTLVVSNQNANFALLADNSAPASARLDTANGFDASKLGTLVINVKRIGLGDYQLWPNYFNYSASNNYGGSIKNFDVFANLARTNIIRATYHDPDNYNNSVTRDYSLTLGNNEQAGTSSNPQLTLNFGISNAFFLDSICLAHASLSGLAQFNATLLRETNIVGSVTNILTNSCFALFRGTNGGRMSVFTISDLGQSSTNGVSGSNDKCTVSFADGGVDALIDRLYLARDRIGVSGNNAQATFTLGANNLFDVNTAIIAFQDATNNHTAAINCNATLTVTNTAVLRVNNLLTLGYTTEIPANTLALAEANKGVLNIGPGGTVIANNIQQGGLTARSTVNSINVTAGGSLVVSNTICDTNLLGGKVLDTLALSGGSSLTLSVDGSRTNPYVFVTVLAVPTSAATLNIASVKNLTSLQVPLISYVNSGSSAGFVLGTLPPGLHGSLIGVGSPPSEIDLLITPSTNNLVWRGYSGANWNLTDVNWLDVATGLHTNFQTGDAVTFDDAGGIPTTVSITDPIIVPTKITMTNTANFYTFNGSGTIQGGAIFTKTGTNTLEIDATTTITIQVNQGALIGNSSAQIGAASIGAGAGMNFAGNILNGVTCAGTATISGTGNGTLSLQSGGILSQLGTFNGTFTLANGSTLLNSGTFNNMGSPTVSSNAVFINSGNLNGSAMTVDTGGLYKDTGAGISAFTGAIIINATGTFVVGNADGHSQVEYDGALSAAQRARVLLSNNSTNIFGVNANSGTANTLLSFSVDFGNNNTLLGGGGVILITNVGTAPLAAGQSYQLFGSSDGDTTLFEAGTNTAPVIRPPAPGPGLAWDTRTLRNDGLIKIITVSTNPPILPIVPFITNNLVLLTSIVTNNSIVSTNYSTNRAVIINFNWPSTNVGWRLQQQISTAEQGIRAGDSNWAYVYPSWWTNQISVTNTFVSNAADFYRLTYP